MESTDEARLVQVSMRVRGSRASEFFIHDPMEESFMISKTLLFAEVVHCVYIYIRNTWR